MLHAKIMTVVLVVRVPLNMFTLRLVPRYKLSSLYTNQVSLVRGSQAVVRKPVQVMSTP